MLIKDTVSIDSADENDKKIRRAASQFNEFTAVAGYTRLSCVFVTEAAQTYATAG